LFKPQGLGIRLGVENKKIQHHIQPYIDQLKQKMQGFPWKISSVQIHQLSSEIAQQPVIAQYYHRRLSSEAIQAF